MGWISAPVGFPLPGVCVQGTAHILHLGTVSRTAEKLQNTQSQPVIGLFQDPEELLLLPHLASCINFLEIPVSPFRLVYLHHLAYCSSTPTSNHKATWVLPSQVALLCGE
jgi:hypothetical protein